MCVQPVDPFHQDLSIHLWRSTLLVITPSRIPQAHTHTHRDIQKKEHLWFGLLIGGEGAIYRGFLQTAEEVVVLELEDILLPEPVLLPVLVHAQAGLLGEEPGLHGPLLAQECRPGCGLGEPDPSQSRFL